MVSEIRKSSYSKFFVMLLISLCIMYAVMFFNVDKPDHIYVSATRFYMALLMVTPMSILMLTMMSGMYPNKKANTLILLSSGLLFLLSLVFLRTQTPISDRQYMKAMIPHHSSAIMTSKQANLQDAEVKDLASKIIRSQEEEIAQMKIILERLERK